MQVPVDGGFLLWNFYLNVVNFATQEKMAARVRTPRPLVITVVPAVWLRRRRMDMCQWPPWIWTPWKGTTVKVRLKLSVMPATVGAELTPAVIV